MLNKMDKIIPLFLLVCIPVRLLLTYVVYLANPKYKNVCLVVSLLIMASLLYQYCSYTEEQHGAFGQKVWWNNSRLVHLGFCILFAITVSSNKHNKYAWLVILADIVYGIINFMTKHINY